MKGADGWKRKGTRRVDFISSNFLWIQKRFPNLLHAPFEAGDRAAGMALLQGPDGINNTDHKIFPAMTFCSIKARGASSRLYAVEATGRGVLFREEIT